MANQHDQSRSYTAGEALVAYRLVKYVAGTGVMYADQDDAPVGVTMEAADSGAPVGVRLLTRGNTFKIEAAGAFSDGDPLYAADDGKVDDATGGGKARFTALAAASAASSIVECQCIEADGGLIHAAIANGTSLENSTTETTLASKTIDGGQLKVGDVIEILASVFVEDNNSTDTLTLKLYAGTEEIVSTGAVDVADNDVGFIHAFLTVRAVGASGAISGAGVQALGVPGTVTAKPWYKAQATEDISGDVALAIKGTWSVAHADNECESQEFLVKIHRQ